MSYVLPQPLDEDQLAAFWWHQRQSRRLRAGEPSSSEAHVGEYNATTNLCVGGSFDGLALPAAVVLDINGHFSVSVAGTLSTLANAPEIHGQAVVAGDALVVTTAGYIIRKGG